MLHGTTAGWPPVSAPDARDLPSVVTRIMTNAYDETHGGVASGPLG
jgi:hypothetical protein